MKLNKNKTKEIKEGGINIIISAVIALAVYYIFQFYDASTETWFFMFTFLLLFILLEQK
ncbi:MAG: hypothetical protein ABIH72_04980 [archaeon]